MIVVGAVLALIFGWITGSYWLAMALYYVFALGLLLGRRSLRAEIKP
jgi:hypothetical protein